MLRRLQAVALDPLSRDWATVVSGNLARLGLGFVSSVLIARSLGPADFGVFALLGAIGNVVGALADVGLTDAAVNRIAKISPTDRQAARARAGAFVALRLTVTVVVILGGALVTALIPTSLLPFSAAFRGLLWLVLLGVTATALSGTVAGLLQATKRFGRLALIGLTNAALTAVLAAVLTLIHRLDLVTALVILGIATSLVSAAVGVRLLPAAERPLRPGRRTLRIESGELIGLARWLGVANVCAMLTAQLDLFLLSHWGAPATLGAYALALNLASKVDVVNSSLYTVLLPTASALTDRDAVYRYIRGCLLRSAAIGLPLLLLIPLIVPFVAFFYGTAYLPAIPLFQRLLAVVIFDVFATPLLLLAYHFNRPRLLAGAEALRAGTLAGSGALLVPRFGPNGAIVAKLAAKLVGAAFTLGLLARPRRTAPSAAAPARRTGPS